MFRFRSSLGILFFLNVAFLIFMLLAIFFFCIFFLFVQWVEASSVLFFVSIFRVRLSRSMFHTRSSPMWERAPYLASVTCAAEGTHSTSTLACICRTTPKMLEFCFSFPSFLVAEKLLFVRDTSRTLAQVTLRP